MRAQTGAAVRHAFQHLMLQSVDGIVLVESQMLDTTSPQLPPAMPVVADGDSGHRYPHVDFDQAHGAHSAVAHLLGLGHRTVRHLAGPRDSFAARCRAESWRRTLTDAGASVPPLVHGDRSAESGHQAGLGLAHRPEVTAVFAGNDQMALGLMRTLHESGRGIPGDISVAGFDDVAEASRSPAHRRPPGLRGGRPALRRAVAGPDRGAHGRTGDQGGGARPRRPLRHGAAAPRHRVLRHGPTRTGALPEAGPRSPDRRRHAPA
ncbi:substrate-binding domain-containing protein [Streptomyces sp. NPDC017868]|uniref:substrate-binding domain-containing protein n=1 Tax=Streptomyces sp. NPDC017868 TaxID=3365014 RepID=UPI0037A22E81